jgi:hypothetical protein
MTKLWSQLRKWWRGRTLKEQRAASLFASGVDGYDDIGGYVELTGPVVWVDWYRQGALRVYVRDGETTRTAWTPPGPLTEWIRDRWGPHPAKPRPPEETLQARCRFYDWGGGFYPDDRVMGFTPEGEPGIDLFVEDRP